jgi:hypothetical protein
MSSSIAKKSKKVSVSKQQLANTADQMEVAAVTAAIAGQMEAAHGVQQMQAAGQMSDDGTTMVAMGASEVTRAIDASVVSERLEVLSDAVAGAGIMDVAEGAAMLAESEDVGVMSALVGMMSEDSLDHGLELARLSGELVTVSELVAELRMPVLADFLSARSDRLHQMSIEQIRVAISTEGVSQLLSVSGTRINALGENEVDEGLTRLEVAEAAQERSAAMAQASDELAAQGIQKIVVGEGLKQIARDEAIEGAKEIAEGSAVVGAAIAVDEVASALKEKSKE